MSKRVVAIVEEGIMPHIEDKWQRLPKKLRSLDSFFTETTGQKDGEGYSLDPDEKLTSKETWLEFIEK